MNGLPFVDAHIHLWDLAGPIRYPWLSPPFSDEGPNGSVEPIATSYLPGAYLAKDAGDGNPGKGFIRVALVANSDEVRRGLGLVRDVLYR